MLGQHLAKARLQVTHSAFEPRIPSLPEPIEPTITITISTKRTKMHTNHNIHRLNTTGAEKANRDNDNMTDRPRISTHRSSNTEKQKGKDREVGRQIKDTVGVGKRTHGPGLSHHHP